MLCLSGVFLACFIPRHWKAPGMRSLRGWCWVAKKDSGYCVARPFCCPLPVWSVICLLWPTILLLIFWAPWQLGVCYDRSLWLPLPAAFHDIRARFYILFCVVSLQRWNYSDFAVLKRLLFFLLRLSNKLCCVFCSEIRMPTSTLWDALCTHCLGRIFKTAASFATLAGNWFFFSKFPHSL